MRGRSGTEPRPDGTLEGNNAPTELLGAHVSTQGGPFTAPARGSAIGASAIQMFTKTPNMWREPVVTPEVAARFHAARAEHPAGAIVSHDSYLINLASPDPVIQDKSRLAFQGELTRSEILGLDGIVSHPGNFIDQAEAGIARNASMITEGLRAVPGRVMLLLETTAGSGTVLGRTFEELRQAVPPEMGELLEVFDTEPEVEDLDI